jgi:benzoate membrane transport protein
MRTDSGHASRRAWRSACPAARAVLHDFNAAAAWAGLTTFIWYAVGMVPVQVAITGQFGLGADQVSSWIFIIWFTGAISSIALSLAYRQPIPITSTIPGLIFMGTLAGQYSVPELLGANLLAGVLMVLLGMSGVGGRLLALLPMPIAMGMLAGSILPDLTRAVAATTSDALVAGATVSGYLLGRIVRSQRVPPPAIALICGGVAVIVTFQGGTAPIAWSLPSVMLPPIELSLSSFIAVSLPMVVLSMGLGNVQGLGFLQGQGYRAPVSVVTCVLGVNSIVNAFFGGHAAIVSRNGLPIMASPDAGPLGTRYWANIVAAILTLAIALAAGPVASLLGTLPSSYVVTLAGVAILPSFQNAMEQTLSGKLSLGAIVAFIVAATPFSVLGITSAFWAIVAAVLVSFVAERPELLKCWRGDRAADEDRPEPPISTAMQPIVVRDVVGSFGPSSGVSIPVSAFPPSPPSAIGVTPYSWTGNRMGR